MFRKAVVAIALMVAVAAAVFAQEPRFGMALDIPKKVSKDVRGVAEKKEYHQTTKYGEDYAYVETYDDDADRFAIIGEAMAMLKEEGYVVEYSTTEVRNHWTVIIEERHTYAYTHKKGNKVLETHIYTLLTDATKNKVMQHYILARKVTKQ